MGTPAFTLGPANLLEARLPASCIGSPASLRTRVDMYWDPSPSADSFCDCTNSYAPANGEWTPPAYRGPGVHNGYWMVASDGSVYAFGDAPYLGGDHSAIRKAVDIESTHEADGYGVLFDNGWVFGHGWIPPGLRGTGHPGVILNEGEKAVSLAITSNDRGYIVFTDRGRAIPMGNALNQGDLAGRPLNGPVLDSNASPFGASYFAIASDGGVFGFGPDARFDGSMGGKPLNRPVVGMAPDPDGFGYWLVAGDGGVFSFDARFRGSMADVRLNRPVIGMVPYGDGYLMVASDGGIFNFSSKRFAGSLGDDPPPNPIVAVAPIRT
jgi:hypothetical protein